MTRDTYWAAEDDAEELVCVLEDRVSDYYQKIVTRGIWDVMRRSYRTYYGMSDEGNDHESSLITFVGEQGELSSLKINHYRSLLRHQVNMAASARPQFSPRPRNTDQASFSNAKIATAALQYAMKDRGIDELEVQTLEAAAWAGWAFLWLYWDTALPGPTGEERAGDICAEVLTPLDVITDVARNPRDPDWYLVRTLANKWDLAARFPEHADQLASTQVSLETFRYSIGEGPAEDQTHVSTDELFVYHWYHKPTDALPNGRYMMFTSKDAILIEPIDLMYDEMPVYRLAPSELIGSPFAYGDNWDLLGLQKAYDAAASTILTNMDSYGVPNMAIQEGSDMTPHELAGGMNIWSIPPDSAPPQVIQMLNLPKEAFEVPRFLKGDMNELSGVNATMRGSPEANIKSGAMAALFAGLAREFNSAIMRSYTKHLERVASGIVGMMRRYADGERVGIVVGRDGQDELLDFKREQLEGTDRFIVELQGSMESNAAGRYEIAQQAYQKQDINLEEFLHMVRTGDFTEKWKAPRADRSLIRDENESLEDLKPVQALIFDDHPRHIQEHASVLKERHNRDNPELANAVQQHIADHMQKWLDMPPDMASLLGIPPPPSLAGPPGPGGPPPGPPPGPGGPPPGPPPGSGGASGPNDPGLPINPETGERADVPPPPQN